MLKMIATVVPLALFGLGCQCSSEQWGYQCDAFAGYTVSNLQKTPEGIGYDLSGQDALVTLSYLDTAVDAVEQCLGVKIDRTSFVVKVAGDWYQQPVACLLPQWGPQQLLPIAAPQAGCTDKGFTASTDCPCEWRGGVRCGGSDSQGRLVLIETPNLLLFKDNLIRVTMNTSDPWSNKYAACAAP